MSMVRQLDVDLWCVTAGSFEANSYIVADGSVDGCILVDVGLNPQAIQDALTALGRRPTAIYCTHGHFDHLGGAVHFRELYGIPTFLHQDDLKTAKSNNFLLMLLKMPERIALPQLSLVEDGFSAQVGGELLRYIHAPGHTPGSCVLSLSRHLFTGDTIYTRGISLAKTAGEQPDILRRSVLSLWDMLADFIIHPGHGPSAPGAIVRAENRPLRAFLGIAGADERATNICDDADNV